MNKIQITGSSVLYYKHIISAAFNYFFITIIIWLGTNRTMNVHNITKRYTGTLVISHVYEMVILHTLMHAYLIHIV